MLLSISNGSLEKVEKEEKVVREERVERHPPQRRLPLHDHPRLVFNSLSVVFTVS
jgi:hypothetical protein